MDSKKSYQKIKELIDSFIQIYFEDDKEIASFFFKLLEKLKDDDFEDISRGKPEIWASAIIHVIARLNFLYDKSLSNHLEGFHTICDFFNTNKHTVGNKASYIQDELDLGYGDYDFTREDMADGINIVPLPNGFITTVKHVKEIESLVGQITPENFDDKWAEYCEITDKLNDAEEKQRKAELLKHHKEQERTRIKIMEDRQKAAHEREQQRIREKWDKEKENQPDFLNLLEME